MRVEHAIFGLLLNDLASSPSIRDVYFCFRQLDYVDLVHEEALQSIGGNIQNSGLMFQHQSLSDNEQILELFEVCVPVYFQIFSVIWSKMNRGFHRCRHETNTQINTLVFNCEIQLLSQVLEDLLKISKVGDLHIVDFQPCPFDLIVITSHQFSRCPKADCHLVATLETVLLGLG